ncbi:MAG: hypothetical protein OHK0039_35120 [Bacteroidia bacterium]
MRTHADQAQDHQDQPIVDTPARQREVPPPFADNRPEAAAQRQIQALANGSPQVLQARLVQRLADSRRQELGGPVSASRPQVP